MRIKAMAAALLLAATPAVAWSAGQETFIETRGPSGLLKGTMLAPASGPKAPVVLILPGSGPTDRDGNNPLGVKASIYKLLAEGLAERGITSARIDKRGMFASSGAAKDANQVTIGDYAADTHAWARMLRAKTGAPCVWVLGHSEGALVASAAARDPKDICGLILVAGPGRRMGEVLREQLKANPANAPLLADALAALDKLEKGQKADVSHYAQPVQNLFKPAVQPYIIDALSYDPVALVRGYKGPVLVMQGTTDLQVSMQDAERLAAARPGVKLVKLEGVNHVLKTAPPERPANLATYADPSLPIAPGVVDAVASFVTAR